MNYRQHLIILIEGYAKAKGLSASRVSTLALNAGHTYQSLVDGKDITVGRLEEAVRWFSANWPEGCDWPQGIARPAVSTPASPEAA